MCGLYRSCLRRQCLRILHLRLRGLRISLCQRLRRRLILWLCILLHWLLYRLCRRSRILRVLLRHRLRDLRSRLPVFLPLALRSEELYFVRLNFHVCSGRAVVPGVCTAGHRTDHTNLPALCEILCAVLSQLPPSRHIEKVRFRLAVLLLFSPVYRYCEVADVYTILSRPQLRISGQISYDTQLVNKSSLLS